MAESEARRNWVHFRLKEGERLCMCKKCLVLSSRPRIAFNEEGVCNACLHAEAKRKMIDWKKRWKELEALCDKHRRNDGKPDVIVPCSGGKDGSYVAWSLKHKLGMHPLCVTFAPPMPTEIGKKNLESFINSGYDHMLVTPNPEVHRKMSRIAFMEEGRPKMSFTGISSVPIRVSVAFGIPLIVYGEEGESEYGGTASLAEKIECERKALVDVFFSGYEAESYIGKNGLTKNDVWWWCLPSAKELKDSKTAIVHWSYFEDWDSEMHAKVVKEKCGFQGLAKPSIGTYTNYAQLDCKLQDLNVYLMYIKFGFGRAWSDACIDIRRETITRKQGLEYVKEYDGIFPHKYLQEYLDYFRMSKEAFWRVVDSFRSPDIWKKDDMKWRLKFDVGKLAEANRLSVGLPEEKEGKE